MVAVHSEDKQKYVQNVLEADAAGLTAEPTKVGVLLCGQKEMCEAVTGILTAKGVATDLILKNF